MHGYSISINQDIMQAASRVRTTSRCFSNAAGRAQTVRPVRATRENDAPSTSNFLAAGVVATGAALLLAIVPPSAEAVSGGGGISAPISGMDLSNQDLRKRSFTKAIMRLTNFSGSNLEGVSFFGGVATNANFHGANMTNADLESGTFDGADFSDAILQGAFVNNAQFNDVNITNSDWTDVMLRKDINKALCKFASGTNPVTGVDTRESLNCP